MATATKIPNSERYDSVFLGEVLTVDFYLDPANTPLSTVNLERGDEVPQVEASSTADGVPVTTAVKVDDAIFTAAMVGRKILFAASSNEYTIVTFTDTKNVVVDSSAAGEADADAVSVYSGYYIQSALHQQPKGQARPFVRVKALKPVGY